ncbi:MAG: type I-G CRISPR-associated protein Cas8g1/Csx17, partial [Methylobacter sp.]
IRNQPTEATRTVESLLSSQATRFAEYRQLLAQARQMLTQSGFQESPKNEDKNTVLQLIRNSFPDTFLSWLDAALLISQDKTFFPPLLGTGGNDGNLDFTNNFMQRQLQLFDAKDGIATQAARSWLLSALFEYPTSHLQKDAAIGQFSPGNAGGPNATAGFESSSLINPWDFVLMLEGSLLFAANTTRRFQQDNAGALSYPFTVRNTGGGSGSSEQSDEANARAEIWLPLWHNPASLAELRTLFQEGRATVGRRPAKDGLDFARAVAALGVDRGIGEFQRYGFMMRSGKAYLATPMGRIQTRHNPTAELCRDLDKTRFLENLRGFARKAEAPGRIVSLVHQLENRLFELTRNSNPKTVQDILMLLGKLQRTLSISAKGREAVRRPMPLLRHAAWLLNADDGSAEFRLACALAGLSTADLPMRVHFAPVKAKEQAWDEHSRLAVWGEGAFESNMTALLRTRFLAAKRLQHKDKPFNFSFGTDCSDIAAFLESATDDRRIGELAQGLALIKNIPRNSAAQHRQKPQSVLPGAYTVLKPFFTTDEVLQKTGFLAADCKLPFRAEILAGLAANQSDKAVKLAWDKLKHAGVALPAFPNQPPGALGINGPRLLAALAIPIEFGQLAKMLRSITKQQKPSD